MKAAARGHCNTPRRYNSATNCLLLCPCGLSPYPTCKHSWAPDQVILLSLITFFSPKFSTCRVYFSPYHKANSTTCSILQRRLTGSWKWPLFTNQFEILWDKRDNVNVRVKNDNHNHHNNDNDYFSSHCSEPIWKASVWGFRSIQNCWLERKSFRQEGGSSECQRKKRRKRKILYSFGQQT